MYREDDPAHAARAGSLIDEIADLERKKVAHAAAEKLLDDAKRELADLQAVQTVLPAAPPVVEKPPSVLVHVLVFAGTAGAAFLGYTLLI